MLLAKPALLLLGMVNERESGAYEILKKIDQMDMIWWFPIGDSTIYATMRKLESKGYIIGQTRKDGKMPEKTIYSITESGKKVLLESIEECFQRMDFDTSYFVIAMRYQNIFTQDKLESLLHGRLSMLLEYKSGIAEKVEQLQQVGATKLHIANLLYMGDVVNAQIESVNRFIDMLLTT